MPDSPFDVIREALAELNHPGPTIDEGAYAPDCYVCKAQKALAALEAEHQQLREAARAYLDAQDRKHRALASEDAETFKRTFFPAHRDELEAWERLRALAALRGVPAEPGRQP